jgi:hypothetical protein
MAVPPAPTRPQDDLAAIPDPTHVRYLIGTRYAEIRVLKKLLRAAESRNKLFPSTTAAQPQGVSCGN